MEKYRNIFNNKKKNGSAALGAADPFIIKYNGYYYLTCTRKDGLVIMKSFDLIHWENVGNNGVVGNDETLKYAYAPEIVYYDGYFYACASPSGNGHYLYKSESIYGEFLRITDNFQELIDGSFFIDKDEEKYFLRATETGIVIKHFKNEIATYSQLFDNYHYFKDGIIGNWTEGPYLIKRYGYYYLTFTGTHFLSDAYRINYASGKSINTSTSLIHQGLLLISTTKEFYGLGHSMNILGPNLDSYYIVYHNMMPNKNRYLNLSRLMFNNKGQMLVNGIQIDDNFMFKRPYFETFIDDKNYISEEKFEASRFSIEYNFKSKNIELILGYQNEQDYQKFVFENNELILKTIKYQTEKAEVIHTFKYKYDMDKYHCLRIQYKKNRLAIYFDLIEIQDNVKIQLNSGKIGFKNNSLEKAYIAYSNQSFGSSDIVDCKVDNFFLDNMLKNKNNYQTNIFIKEKGYYDFYINQDACLENVKIDNKIISKFINDRKIVSCIYLKKGIHKLSFNIITGKFNQITYFINRKNELNLNDENYLENMKLFGKYLKYPEGIYFENDRNALLTNFEIENYEVNCNLEIIGLAKKQEHVAGLLVDVNNYSKVNEFESVYSLQGYALLINTQNIYVVECDFNFSKILKKMKINSSLKDINLKIKKSKTSIRFYLEDKEIYKLKVPSKFIKGKVGLYMNHASVIFKKFNLKKEEN